MTGNSTTHAPSIEPRRTPPSSGRARAGFREALVAEGIKIRTVRSTVWTPVVMVALILATAVFVGASESLQPDDTILGGSLTGAVTAQMAAAIFGVLAISGEYSTGTIRTTFTACPRRPTVLAAKAVVVAGVTFVVGFLACFLAYQIGTLMLSGKGYASGEPMPALRNSRRRVTASRPALEKSEGQEPSLLSAAPGMFLRLKVGWKRVSWRPSPRDRG